jgi:hypothetical protein
LSEREGASKDDIYLLIFTLFFYAYASWKLPETTSLLRFSSVP